MRYLLCTIIAGIGAKSLFTQAIFGLGLYLAGCVASLF